MKFLLLTFFVLAATSNPAFANWVQFRGPNALGVGEGSVPVEWSDTKNMKWVASLPGEGSSSPIVWGDSAFVTCYSGAGEQLQRSLVKIDLNTGEILWERSVGLGFSEDPGEGYITEHGWASNTPVTDGRAIYCYFGKAGVYAFDFDGEELWHTETGGMSSQKRWGSASSAILYKGKLIVPAGEETRSILALDISNGYVLWKAEGDSLEQTYGTPILVEVDEHRTDIVFASTGEWWGLNPETGKLRWFAEYNLPGNMSNTTHLSGDILTISGGFPRTARVALKVGETGDVSGKLLYDTQKPATYMTAPVEHAGVLYWVSDSGIAFAAEPGSSEELWQERIPEIQEGRGKPFYASPVIAGGKIYAVSRANGTFVIEPSREGLKVLARNRIEGDDTIFNAAPAVADGKLLIRSQDRLYCIGE